ncbi:sorting nexin-10A-like isoform X2 [Oncorhynchus nerka]|uniref:sorting nexin-10A-like isoform X2 n=1 Tax=Oncorhynchus nerka TaxID=8023 RepID=UPI001131F46D|nr:sorting nexin-10A-like isoform X2 [Oncorhynchus nerka]
MDRIDSLMKQEFVSVWVQDPQFHKDDFWHTHIDYEICLHRVAQITSLESVLQSEQPLSGQPADEGSTGVSRDIFLISVLQDPLLLSDSRVHLFLQSQLSVTKMEACVSGQTRYTVAQAIQMCSDCHRTRFPVEKSHKDYCDSNGESTTSSGLGHSHDSGVPQSSSPLPCDSSCKKCDGSLTIRDRRFFSRESSCDQEHTEP